MYERIVADGGEHFCLIHEIQLECFLLGERCDLIHPGDDLLYDNLRVAGCIVTVEDGALARFGDRVVEAVSAFL